MQGERCKVKNAECRMQSEECEVYGSTATVANKSLIPKLKQLLFVKKVHELSKAKNLN